MEDTLTVLRLLSKVTDFFNVRQSRYDALWRT